MNPSKLDFYIANNLNVLFRGKHGVGKTSLVVSAFQKHNLKHRIFSAATMDPWVDFIGVPKEVKNGDGKSYLELVRPKEFRDDEVEAIFFDEFNRSHKKVRNAVMELIQFKSINGQKFNRLRFIWAAINPDDDADTQYDVEKLDKAQEDRFHITVNIPFVPDHEYFAKKFGGTIAKSAIIWWKKQADKIKNDISPRRLDYALEIFNMGGDLREVLPSGANVSDLLSLMVSGPVDGKLKEFFASQDVEKARAFLMNENNYAGAIPLILKSPEWLKFFLPLVDKEKIVALISSNATALNVVTTGYATHSVFREVVDEVMGANTNRKLVKSLASTLSVRVPERPHWIAKPKMTTQALIANVSVAPKNNTYDRKLVWETIFRNVAQTMTSSEAHNLLQVIDTLVGSCYSSTLQGLIGLMGTVNHLVHTAGHKKEDWRPLNGKSEVVLRYRNISRKLVNDGNLGKKFLY